MVNIKDRICESFENGDYAYFRACGGKDTKKDLTDFIQNMQYGMTKKKAKGLVGYFLETKEWYEEKKGMVF